MTEPQVWTTIAVFAALMFGMLTIVSTLFVNVVKGEIGKLDAKLTGRIDNIDTRMDNLDRNVQALMHHMFGIDRG